jgi:hypothetical protein
MQGAQLTELAALLAPFPQAEVSFRVGAVSQDKTRGQALAYIDARNVQDRLDAVVGPANWSTQFLPLPTGQGLLCRLSIFVDGRWVAKEDGTSLEQVAAGDNTKQDMAIKALMSDAFKRAAVMWGIGRYLYALDAPWVALDGNKRMKESPVLPDWALPEAERGQERPPAKVAAAEPAPKARREPSRSSPLSKDEAAMGAAIAAEVFGNAAAPQGEASPPAPAKPVVSKAVAVPAGEPVALPEGAPALGKTALGLYEKYKKGVPLNMLINFINGPKAADTTSAEEREWLLNTLQGGAL